MAGVVGAGGEQGLRADVEKREWGGDLAGRAGVAGPRAGVDPAGDGGGHCYVYSLVLPSSVFGVVHEERWIECISHNKSNWLQHERPYDERAPSNAKEAIPHRAAHKALKNQPGKWVLLKRPYNVGCPK